MKKLRGTEFPDIALQLVTLIFINYVSKKDRLCACPVMYIHKVTSRLIRLLSEACFEELLAIISYLHVRKDDTGKLEVFCVIPILKDMNNYFVSYRRNIFPQIVSVTYTNLNTYCDAVVILSTFTRTVFQLLTFTPDSSASHYGALSEEPTRFSVLHSQICH
jgi:hypothetical protein